MCHLPHPTVPASPYSRRDNAMFADNKQVASNFLNDVINDRDFSAATSYFADDVADHLPGSLATYLALAAFPDFQLTIEHMVAEKDLVTVLTTFTGTHRGTFSGIPATETGVTGRAAF